MSQAIDDLMAFVSIGRTGSFKSAAAQLGRDASVISRRISQLELKLGVKLLTRTTRSVSLTEAGSMYFNRLQHALEEIDIATREVSNFASTPQGVLKVSAPATFAREIVTSIFAKIISQYPKIKIDAHFEDRAVDVVGEGYDVVIRVGLLSNSSLICRQIGGFRSLLVASPMLMADKSLPVSPADLENINCIGFTKHPDWPSWILEDGDQQATLQPPCALVTDSSEAVLVSALQGVGIALVPDLMAAPHIAAGRLVQILPEWRSTRKVAITALMPPGSLLPAKTRIIVDALTEAFHVEQLQLR